LTTIVAVADRGRVHIGSDSQVSSGHSKISLEGGKISRNGEYTWGLAGLLEMIERLKRAEWPAVEGDVETHVREVLTPFLLETQSQMFEDFGIDENSDNPFFQAPRSTVLVTVRGKIFELHLEKGLSPLRRADGKYAIGSGSVYARGALNGTRKTGKNVVLAALEAAAENDLYTHGPFYVKTVR
jgi:ATP-dependent protease HslVU (ClpYQ) peptidase subunit